MRVLCTVIPREQARCWFSPICLGERDCCEMQGDVFSSPKGCSTTTK
uniref:Uncharacterized protein n=1 Tax=Anguilla anguilla TaxID=7936 RepID=A0A0E9UXB5_ANGAN